MKHQINFPCLLMYSLSRGIKKYYFEFGHRPWLLLIGSYQTKFKHHCGVEYNDAKYHPTLQKIGKNLFFRELNTIKSIIIIDIRDNNPTINKKNILETLKT